MARIFNEALLAWILHGGSRSQLYCRGALLSESLQAGSNAAARKSYDAGYEKGRSDAAKLQYQTLNERQRIAPQFEDAANFSLFDVLLPEREEDCVILAPSTATLRIHE